MTGNYYYQNDEEIELFIDSTEKNFRNREVLLSFDVPSGEVLDFLGNLTTDEKMKKNDKIWFELVQDGQVVATSVDCSASSIDADNLSMALLYQAKMDTDSTFDVVAEVFSRTHRIPASQLQISYKTYGEGLELTLL